MKVIDFRLRPPCMGFLSSTMYAAGEQRDNVTRLAGFEPSSAAQSQSLTQLLAEMDAADVEAGVVVGRYTGQKDDVSNEDIAQIVAATPGRFIGAASINATSRGSAFKTINAAKAQGFKLINIEPGFYSPALRVDDRRLYPIYALCEDLDLPIVLMSGGTAGPDLSYSDPIRLDRMLMDFPRLKVVAAHAGWPWVTETIHVAFRRKNLYLCPDIYFSRMPGWEQYMRVADSFLADRILYASGFPNCPVRAYKEWFEKLPIKHANLERVMSINARELLSL